jgi:hypothetical protein
MDDLYRGFNIVDGCLSSDEKEGLKIARRGALWVVWVC